MDILNKLITRHASEDKGHCFQSGFDALTTTAMAMVLVGVFSFVIYVILEKIDKNQREQWGRSLQAVLNTTSDALYHWRETQEEMAVVTANNTHLVRLVENLLVLPRDRDELEFSFELSDMRTLMMPAIKSSKYVGFRVISPDHYVIAAHHAKGVGANPALNHYPKYLERAFSGETVLTPPFSFKHPHHDGALRPAQFVITPIRNTDHEIIAVLALHLEQTEIYGHTASLARIGETGDSYIFDSNGRALSELRYDDQLVHVGILEDDNSSLMNAIIRDPGHDISQKVVELDGYHTRPLTQSTASAIKGMSGSDFNGYRDYRGVMVLGAWHWDHDLGIGLAVELGLEEVLAPYRIIRAAVLWVFILIIALINQRSRAVLKARQEVKARRTAEKALQELAESQELNHLLLDSTAEGIYGIDPDGRCIFANPASVKLLGYTSADEMLGQDMHRLIHHSHEDGEEYPDIDCPVKKTLQSGDVTHTDSDVFWRKDGTSFPVEYRALAMEKEGQVVGVVTTFSDITKRKENESKLLENKRQLEDLAYFDPLTGLPNRRLLNDRLEQALANADRNNAQVAICYLDLDGFKPVNDDMGHESGDLVLCEISSRLVSSLRDIDTVSRLGGDEFVLVISGMQSTDEVGVFIERVLENISRPFSIMDRQLSMSASIGVTQYPKDNASADTLIRHADQAMYLAKQQGKNQYLFFDSAQECQIVAQQSHVERVAEAIANDELALYFQPKVDMRKGNIDSAEALVRWHHPETGVLAPEEFFPLIENHALAVKLDHWVLADAIRQLEVWKREGRHVKLSVNVMPGTIQHKSFIENIVGLLGKYKNVDASQIVIEIHETNDLDDISEASCIINTARAHGLRFAVDNFGARYSSLSSISHLNVSAIKVDHSFVRDMLVDADALKEVEAIIKLSNAFDLEVIAEGVETALHGKRLLQLGCDKGQGYGIAPPMPAEDFTVWLDEYSHPAEWTQPDALEWPSEYADLLRAEVEVRSWTNRLMKYFSSPVNTPLPELNHHLSSLGLWVSHEGKMKYGKFTHFEQLEILHQKLHKVGQYLVSLHITNPDDMINHLPRLHSAREELLGSLRNIQLAVMEA